MPTSTTTRAMLFIVVAVLAGLLPDLIAQATAMIAPSYTAYLPLVICPTCSDGLPQTSPTPTQPPTNKGDDVVEVLRLVNIEREKVGCPLVAENAILAAAAQAWSDYMWTYAVFDHSDVIDISWYPNHGYTPGAIENIGLGYPSSAYVVQGWMNSPGHRDTLLWCPSTRGDIYPYIYEAGVGRNGNLWTFAIGRHLQPK
jgi:uncharacterized protein YkwD